MDRNDTPQSIDALIAALADGELDLRNNPEALAQIAQDAQAAGKIAHHQRLKDACAKAMDGPDTRCPAELAAKLRSLNVEEPAQTDTPKLMPTNNATPRGAYHGPPVLARLGRWAPTAVAAVLLIAATVLFMQAGDTGPGASAGVASLLSVSDVERFDSRHFDCAEKPDILQNHDAFGEPGDLEQLPVKLADYFKTSADGMKLNLSGVGYGYQLTGVCGIPGSGSVHIVYRHHDDPGRAISLWLAPDDGRLDNIEPDRVYVEAGKTLDHPVIVWRSGGLIYYLVGDSLEDTHQAVDALRGAV
ncbi:MAG: hypothetical protein ACE37H_02650 [Phycisphaeraceae bacterium]